MEVVAAFKDHNDVVAYMKKPDIPTGTELRVVLDGVLYIYVKNDFGIQSTAVSETYNGTE